MLYTILLFALLLTVFVSMWMQFSVFMWLVAFVVCFGAVGLMAFAGNSGDLFRGLFAGALTIAVGAIFCGGTLWTFLWVFFVSDVVLILLALMFLVFICSRVDLNEPQAETDDPFYRSVMDVYIRALMDLVLVRLHTEGLEKTPKEGRFLVVCNHLFLADPGIVLNCFQKSQLSFVTKQENYKMPIINKFMHKILCQSLDREDNRQALKVILKCIQLIKDDIVSVCVFPEGYTSRDGKLHHFRSGVFKIAQKTNVPIVVCTIQGTKEIFKNLKKGKATPVEFHLVDVLQPEDIQGKTTVEVADQVYEMMIADLGEDFRTPKEETT